MKELIEQVEGFLKTISNRELEKNSKASAKALEIKRMILQLKGNVKTHNLENQGVLRYISPKILLEN